MSAFRYNKLWWFLGFLGLSLILGGSLMPSEPGPQLIPNFDKILHFTGYAMATFYFQQLTKNQKIILILVLIFLYSGLIEVLQNFFPSRQMSVKDLMANGLGCLFGSLVSVRLLKGFLVKIDHNLSDRWSR